MKITHFISVSILLIVLNACGSPSDSEDKNVVTPNREVSTYVPKVYKILSSEEEESLLNEISTITDPAVAEKIYYDNAPGSKVEKAAYEKWEQLMLYKISTVTDPAVAEKIYYDNDGDSVEKAAKEKWEQLMLYEISTVTDPAVAEKIYYDNTGIIEEAAKAKWEALKQKTE